MSTAVELLQERLEWVEYNLNPDQESDKIGFRFGGPAAELKELTESYVARSNALKLQIEELTEERESILVALDVLTKETEDLR